MSIVWNTGAAAMRFRLKNKKKKVKGKKVVSNRAVAKKM